MNINHLDLQVHDVGTTRLFFERYFGLRTQSNPGSEALVVMTDDAGFVLVLQRAAPSEHYPKGFHLGFLLDSVDGVRALHAQAVREGTAVSDVIVNGRGTMIYLTAPEGYLVEVSCPKRHWPAPSAAA